MTDLRIITTNGTDAILEEATVQNFADSLRGPLAADPARAVMTRPAKSGMA